MIEQFEFRSVPGKGREIKRSCTICGGDTWIQYSNRDRERVYCGQECRAKFFEQRSTKVERTCETCGKIFYKYPSDIKAGRGRFCSQGCIAGQKVFKICPVCNKVYRVTRIHVNHCSKQCRDKTKKIVSCLTCGKEFFTKPAKVNKFCSPRCYRRFTGETEPEKNVRLCLENMSIEYFQEHSFSGWKYPVDFFLPRINTIIEVDSVYWHSKKSVKDRDARKTLWLQSRGHTVFRVP